MQKAQAGQEESKKAKDKTDKQVARGRKSKHKVAKGKPQAAGASKPVAWQLNVASCSLELVSSQLRKQR